MAVRAPALHGRTLSWTIRCLPRACRTTLSMRLHIRGQRRAARVATLTRRVSATRDRRIAVRLRRPTVLAVHRAWRQHRRVTADLRGTATDGLRHTASFRLQVRLPRPR
jgi:hypothetical protein